MFEKKVRKKCIKFQMLFRNKSNTYSSFIRVIGYGLEDVVHSPHEPGCGLSPARLDWLWSCPSLIFSGRRGSFLTLERPEREWYDVRNVEIHALPLWKLSCSVLEECGKHTFILCVWLYTNKQTHTHTHTHIYIYIYIHTLNIYAYSLYWICSVKNTQIS